MEAGQPGGLIGARHAKAADRTSHPRATGRIDPPDVRDARRLKDSTKSAQIAPCVSAPEESIRCRHACR